MTEESAISKMTDGPLQVIEKEKSSVCLWVLPVAATYIFDSHCTLKEIVVLQ